MCSNRVHSTLHITRLQFIYLISTTSPFLYRHLGLTHSFSHLYKTTFLFLYFCYFNPRDPRIHKQCDVRYKERRKKTLKQLLMKSIRFFIVTPNDARYFFLDCSNCMWVVLISTLKLDSFYTMKFEHDIVQVNFPETFGRR